MTIPVVLVDVFYVYIHHPRKTWKGPEIIFELVFFFFSYGLKITCILLRQVIYLKKMVVLSVTFTIVISWSPICIPLILSSALMRWASTSATILFNSFESWHHWRAHVRVKGSDRRPFILILDSMLAYITCSLKRCDWICLHIRTYEQLKR